MPKAAIFFSFLLISPMIINSYAVPVDQLTLFDNSQNLIFHDSDIIDIDSNYFLLAIIVICNATIRPIDAMIGNNKELS